MTFGIPPQFIGSSGHFCRLNHKASNIRTIFVVNILQSAWPIRRVYRPFGQFTLCWQAHCYQRGCLCGQCRGQTACADKWTQALTNDPGYVKLSPVLPLLTKGLDMTGVKSTDQAVLFLYGGAALVQALKSGLLPLQDELSFLSPYIDLDQWQGGGTQAVTAQEFQTELALDYQRLPDNIRQLLSFEAFQGQADKLADSIRARVLANRQPADLGYNKRRLDKIGFLRLFSSALSHFGWSTLADNQSGICVALNSRSPMFLPTAGQPVLLRRVSYGAEHAFAISANNPLPGFFCDHAEHRARDEWRVAYARSTTSAAEIRLPKNAVTQIYTSINTPPALKQAVQDLVAQDMRYRQVQLFEVQPDTLRWQLSAKPFARA